MTTREIKADFGELKEFICKYAIAPTVNNGNFATKLGIGHKRLFGLLTFIAEIQVSNDNTKKFSEESLRYFAECGSDVSQAFFCWIHGAYKPAYLALRSSIETFIKAAVGTENPLVLTEKSMYELLDFAKESQVCRGLGEPYFQTLKAAYRELCGIAHSATAAKFTQVNALRMFPKFEESDATEFITRFVTVVDRFLAIILTENRELLATMHFKNRQNVLDTLTQDIKRSILGEEVD